MCLFTTLSSNSTSTNIDQNVNYILLNNTDQTFIHYSFRWTHKLSIYGYHKRSQEANVHLPFSLFQQAQDGNEQIQNVQVKNSWGQNVVIIGEALDQVIGVVN